MVTINGGDKFKEFLQTLLKQKASVNVGFFEDAKYPDGLQIAEVAVGNEFGYINETGAVVPPRPFMQPTLEENKSKWVRVLKQQITAQQDKIDIKKALSAVGFVAMNDIKNKIDWWAEQGEPRNAAATIAKKGFDSPLINSGMMRDAVNYEVVTNE